MTYHEAEQYLLSLANMPRREYMKDARHCDIYLKRLKHFLTILDNPEKKIPYYIHITGTSGKGSVASFLQSIILSSGKRVGMLSSPHPTYLFERWQINKQIMPKKEFVRLVQYIKPKLDIYLRTNPYDMLSFPELMTALGFLYFSKKKVPWVVLEVGCGGRYCATNVIPRKEAAIITNIGLDHTEILGNTKEKIAYEKAGIITTNAPVFTMEKNPRVIRVIQKECDKFNAPLISVASHVLSPVYTLNGTTFVYKETAYSIPVLGEHQIRNAILCIDVAHALGISKKQIANGLATVKQPLRMEIISKNPLVILDGAHNPAKIQTSVKTIERIREMKPYTNAALHLILAFSYNKNIRSMIRTLAAMRPQTIACTRNTVNPFRKGANPKNLEQKIKKLLPNAKTEVFIQPYDAFLWAKRQTKKNDIILSTGSLFMSGELRGLL